MYGRINDCTCCVYPLNSNDVCWFKLTSKRSRIVQIWKMLHVRKEKSKITKAVLENVRRGQVELSKCDCCELELSRLLTLNLGNLTGRMGTLWFLVEIWMWT